MNHTIMSVLSLAVIAALVVVLVGFLRRITGLLNDTGDVLVSAVPLALGVRQDCENIVTGVLSLNRNLHVAAAGLTSVAGAAQRRAATLNTRPNPAPPSVTVAAPRISAPAPASDGAPQARPAAVAWPVYAAPPVAVPAAAPEPQPAAASSTTARPSWLPSDL